jgi:hypothetical protein
MQFLLTPATIFRAYCGIARFLHIILLEYLIFIYTPNDLSRQIRAITQKKRKLKLQNLCL